MGKEKRSIPRGARNKPKLGDCFKAVQRVPWDLDQRGREKKHLCSQSLLKSVGLWVIGMTK